MPTRMIYWFRNDLRLDDNEAFWNTVSDADEIIAVYVFDPRRFRVRNLGFRKTGVSRAHYLIQAVANLRKRMEELGAHLTIAVGEPEMIVSELARTNEVSEVRASKEITLEETNIEASLSKKLKGINVDISLTWMSTLIHPHDLPFYISRLPGSFDLFEELVRSVPVREPITHVAGKTFLSDQNPGAIPSLQELGFTDSELIQGEGSFIDCKKEAEIKQDFQRGKLDTERVMNLISFGLVSPREAYHLTKNTEVGKELRRCLLWRDYLQFVTLKYGTRLFKPSGLVHQIDRTWKYDREAFNRWKEGRTADEKVNEYMRKLNTLGVLDTKEMGVVARYLVEEMGVNWTWGASWFESRLNYYEVALNWGNWNYFAGVGPGGFPGEEARSDTTVQH